MKTKAAVLWAPHQDFEVMEVELDAPKDHEVLVHYYASGLCHSDYHIIVGEIGGSFPRVGGHEGAGIVEAVGPGVSRLKPGDHVVTAFLPACGRCHWCSIGRSNLCDLGGNIDNGCLPDGTYRFHARGKDLAATCAAGTFAQRAVISEAAAVKIDETIPFEVACLTGCGVPTGWGSAVKAADVAPGDTVVVYGIGGVGINAVQGAKFAGAKYVVAVDPIAFKREKALELGATHAAATADEAKQIVFGLTNGVWADKSIVTAGFVDEQVVQDAFDIISKGGTLVLTGLGHYQETNVKLNGFNLAMWEKRIQGVVAGQMNFHTDIPKLLGLYSAGCLKLDELITTRYRLEEVNQAFQDMIDGKNIRGVIIHDQ